MLLLYPLGALALVSSPSLSSALAIGSTNTLASHGAPPRYRGYRSAFSFDAGETLHRCWMRSLPDAANLSSLSIPGTHDTMTYAMPSERLQCQNWDLAAQLAAGLRYFDIRARLRDDQLHIYHADGDTGFSLADVMLHMVAFLKENPSETLVVRLKEEGSPIGDANTLDFEQAFVRDRAQLSGFDSHLHPYDAARPIPTLGALRGKMFLLQDFKAHRGGPYGLAWDGPLMALEDQWIVPDIYHLADKWTAIRNAVERAATDPLDNARLYLAHVSASVGVLPIEAAAGPLNHSITSLNDMTGQWLLDFDGRPDARRTGVVILDFPGQQLVNAVLAWNKQLLQGISQE